jgi:hypothetical protein
MVGNSDLGTNYEEANREEMVYEKGVSTVSIPSYLLE